MKAMRYSAIIDSETLKVIDIKTQEATNAISATLSCMSDLELLKMVPKDIAGELRKPRGLAHCRLQRRFDENFDV